jgi:hypothetical protein
MRVRSVVVLLITAGLVSLAAVVQAQDRWRVEFENGAAVSGYNDVRIPGTSGSDFSLTEDLTSEAVYFWRVRGDLRVAPKHVLSGLVAPLRITASGRFGQPVSFAGAVFAPHVPTEGRYVFNSYRVTYRYEPIRTEHWLFGIGVTMKVRDAVIELQSNGTEAQKANVGVVPLVNFKLERRLGERAAFLLEGDALAAPQGRAEDIFAGVLVHAGRQWSVKAGYRFLEGGADNEEVYTFAMIHYLAAGVVFRF